MMIATRPWWQRAAWVLEGIGGLLFMAAIAVCGVWGLDHLHKAHPPTWPLAVAAVAGGFGLPAHLAGVAMRRRATKMRHKAKIHMERLMPQRPTPTEEIEMTDSTTTVAAWITVIVGGEKKTFEVTASGTTNQHDTATQLVNAAASSAREWVTEQKYAHRNNY
jgi:hypothetical protein